MYKVKIKPHWEISRDGNAPLDTAVLLALLTAIQETGSIANAARQIGSSYRHAWGILRDAEKMFGHALIQTGRGRGSHLMPLAEKLIWADLRVAARLSPTLESLASELEGELSKAVSGQPQVIRLNASHGFAVAALLNQLNERHLPVELRYRNSADAVAALSHHECDLAGFHVPLGEFEAAAAASYSHWLDKHKHCLIHLAVRNQGLMVAPSNPKQIRSLHDLVRPGVQFVNRQTGSGTRMLLELMLAKEELSPSAIDGFESAEFTHSAIAAFIASGMADVGFGVQTAAERFGLDFIPLIRERYFFAVSADAMKDPLMQQVIGILQSETFRDIVNQLAGYDGSATGDILSLSKAFKGLY
ncbi:bacterial regulatory helix-turn-helix, lysR family protein [Collimonas arenae]|uniref:Bacterial regulatory helix-turn-helix, lysR family protein n=1 Tax=Collimonas arenae TaxID=279058 RepID=A0A127PLY6_9BURK|nr:substrate-binding domain-containing protein [Collimonas arenae]AMO98775.1 bacterial regulatory helix-turn-helix, lysR family protein [Collimonas arenae]AMP08668.1 bacterial regulatory helix-turn-helix, lysR family protein [Collimonas arenae]